jgi:serine protease inhibitor
MFSRRFHLGGTMVAALAVAACNESATAPNELTELPRALSAAELTVQGAANSFSFALWNRLNTQQPDSNVFVSPLSATFALGMTMNGAANETFDQMRTTLAFGDASQRVINDGYKSLIALLTSLDPRVRMTIANSIWYRRGYPIHEGFLDTTRAFFGARVADLDFADREGSTAIMNAWVSDNTNGKIPSIVDDIDVGSVMFLINAIYFNGRWRTAFDPTKTRDDQFRAIDGSSQSVRMMTRLSGTSYAFSPTWTAVDLPYGNAAFSMTIVVPTEGAGVNAVAQALTPEAWRALVEGLSERDVEVSLPKLRLEYARNLNDDLIAMGMVAPFLEGGADFTRMSPLGRELFISNVKHKAFVDIHEEGTEAAAATVVENRRTIGPGYAVVRADRPFIFIIRERLSGTILFMGKVVSIP